VTPPTYVVDTSVVVKWFVQEGEADLLKAVQLFEAFQEGRCVLKAPQLLLFEIANALGTSRKLPVSTVLDSLRQLRDLELDLAPFSWPTLHKAVEISAACGLTVYDCYFVALALQTDSLLVTADEVCLRKTRHLPSVVALRQLRFPG